MDALLFDSLFSENLPSSDAIEAIKAHCTKIDVRINWLRYKKSLEHSFLQGFADEKVKSKCLEMLKRGDRNCPHILKHM